MIRSGYKTAVVTVYLWLLAGCGAGAIDEDSAELEALLLPMQIPLLDAVADAEGSTNSTGQLQSKPKSVAMAVLESIPDDSDFHRMKTDSRTRYNTTSISLEANRILCLLAHTGYAVQMNRGAYRAEVDAPQCSPGLQTRYTFQVESSRVDAESSHHIQFKMVSNESAEKIFGQVSISRSPTVQHPAGQFLLELESDHGNRLSMQVINIDDEARITMHALLGAEPFVAAGRVQADGGGSFKVASTLPAPLPVSMRVDGEVNEHVMPIQYMVFNEELILSRYYINFPGSSSACSDRQTAVKQARGYVAFHAKEAIANLKPVSVGDRVQFSPMHSFTYTHTFENDRYGDETLVGLGANVIGQGDGFLSFDSDFNLKEGVLLGDQNEYVVKPVLVELIPEAVDLSICEQAGLDFSSVLSIALPKGPLLSSDLPSKNYPDLSRLSVRNGRLLEP